MTEDFYTIEADVLEEEARLDALYNAKYPPTMELPLSEDETQ